MRINLDVGTNEKSIVVNLDRGDVSFREYIPNTHQGINQLKQILENNIITPIESKINEPIHTV